MTSEHLVRSELRQFLRDFPTEEMTAERMAALRERPLVSYAAAPDVPTIRTEERYIPGPEGAPDVRVLIYRPVKAPSPAPAILHIHGGGYVIGLPEMSDAGNKLFAGALNAVIVSVDYRLAPEHPFPAPLEDCYAALKWLHANAGSLNVDPARIAIKGESAGGGLAAGLALLARDRAEVPIVFQCLTYPMIEDRAPSDPHPYAGEFTWTADSNRFGWSAYLGREPGGPGVSPYAAAARATDLAGLPPTLIVAVTLDLFLEENFDYARRLTRAGVPVEFLVYPGTYHGFQMAGDSEISRRYMRDVREALAAALLK